MPKISDVAATNTIAPAAGVLVPALDTNGVDAPAVVDLGDLATIGFVTNAIAVHAARQITLQAPGAAFWTSMPSALTEFRGTTAARLKADCSLYTQARISVRMVGVAGVAGSVLGVQYSTDESTWNWLDDAASPTSGANVADISATNTTSVSSWINLAAAARDDVFLRLAGQGGDGSVSPQFGLIALELR